MCRHLPAATLLCAVLASACSPPPRGLELAPLAVVERIDVTIGSSCRRLEAPDQIAALLAFRSRHRTGWEPFWGAPIPPQIQVVFRGEDDEVSGVLGLASGQLLAPIDGAATFQSLSSSEAARFLALVGGPAGTTTAKDTPCPAALNPSSDGER